MFVHLHCHFTGSYSDSVLRIEDGVRRASRLGQPAIAMTEHGEMPFIFEFEETCRKYRVKPLYGAEIYFVPDAELAIRKRINDRYHLVLLAKDLRGLRNLFALLSDSWVLNSYLERRGLVDWALLEKYAGGLIATTGCFFNLIGQSFLKEGEEAAEKVLKRYRDIFGGDFYVEVARHGIPDEEKVNEALVRLAVRNGVKPVLTNDVHYLGGADWPAQEVVMKTRHDHVNDFSTNSREFWLKSESEMLALGFPREYAERTSEVAGKCEIIGLPRAVQGAAGHGAIDIDGFIASGRAAYLARVIPIDRATALRHAAEALGKDSPHADVVADAITGIPRRSEPDNDHVVVAPQGMLREIVPLKRAMGKVMTQWDETSCRKAGALILSAVPSPLAEKLSRFNQIIK